MSALLTENKWKITDDANLFYQRTGLISHFEELLSLGFARSDYSGAFWGPQVEALINYCKNDPCYHIITITVPGRYENRYIPGKNLYYLADGDQNPTLILDLLLHKSLSHFAKEGLTKAFAIIFDGHRSV